MMLMMHCQDVFLILLNFFNTQLQYVHLDGNSRPMLRLRHRLHYTTVFFIAAVSLNKQSINTSESALRIRIILLGLC